MRPTRWVSGRQLLAFVPAIGVLFLASPVAAQKPWQMSGYLLAPNEPVPTDYGGGFSMYVAAWPLLTQYPGNRFQTGLFGTWMYAHYEEEPAERLYSTIEGGLGWWRDTRFATETPKFIMGGVAHNFSMWANGPGAGKGRDWDNPSGRFSAYGHGRRTTRAASTPSCSSAGRSCGRPTDSI